MTERMIWLWLSLHFGAGSKVYRKLYEHFDSVEDIFECDDADVELIPGLKDFEKNRLLDKSTKSAELVMAWCKKYDVEILTPSDEKYPLPLRALDDFPAALYCIGELPDFQNKLCIGVVGSREMSAYGRDNAFTLGYGLTKGGALVVSGMAKGIDTAAQKGAMFADGSTIAVLGCGINYIYPRENEEVYKKILKVGAAITEYPPDTPPNSSNFPVRNRLISGLSSAIVVVESRQDGGALITARRAQKQRKKIFAFPGRVNDPHSVGNNQLLTEGVEAVTSAVDVLEKYMDVYGDSINIMAAKMKPNKNNKASDVRYQFKEGFLYERSNYSRRSSTPILDPKQSYEVKEFDTSNLDEDTKLVYNAMKQGIPVNVNGLKDLNINREKVISSLGLLELLGAVTESNGYYTKK